MILKTLIRIIRPKQILLTLPLAFLGILFARSSDYEIWIGVILALISAKGAHTMFYMAHDSEKNLKSPRDIDRSIPNMEIEKNVTWLSGIIFSGIFVSSSYMLNEYCYYLSIVSTALFFFYPLIKKFSPRGGKHYSGIFETICPLGGFIAADNRLEPTSILLSIAVFLWIAGLEIINMIYDMEFDTKQNRATIPIRIGGKKAQILSGIFYFLSLLSLIFAGVIFSRGIPYWVSLICVLIIFIKQRNLLQRKDTVAAKAEFFQINIFITPILFFGTLIDKMF